VNNIRVITRNSNLALVQCDEVAQLLPQTGFDLIPVASMGDKMKHLSLMGDIPADFFTRELDEALLRGDADIAVHSAKDLPYPLAEGLEIVALLPAKDQSDSLVSVNNLTLSELPAGSRIGTSSPKRKEQILSQRPDLTIVSIRGTIEERIAQVDNGDVDALIVATCALERLDLTHRIAERLPFETHPLQGHLAIVAKKGNEPVKEIFAKFDIRAQWGQVIIAGFGPGDPGLVTRKTETWLSLAEVIIYDDLVDATYLRKFCADKIYVGKRKGAHYSQQDEINALMHQHAIAGKKVVRIKGGDPLIFGRGAEEYHFLAERLVQATIIPGISSALAAAADAVIPLTARGISSSVVFLSGHDLVKMSIPKADTLVFYMGASNQKELSLRLQAEGWHSQTPVAIIRNASQPTSELRRYTLQSLAEELQPLESPLIIIVGYSAAANPAQIPSRWLFTGIHVADFKEDGICVHSPMIAIQSVTLGGEQKAILQKLGSFNRVIFTSRHAVEHFFTHLLDNGLDARCLSGVTITAIGNTTLTALRGKGILANLVTDDDSSDGLVKWFAESGISSERILVPRSAIGLPVLPEGLRNLGHEVTILPVYTTVMPDNIIRHQLADFEGVVFTSPSTVDNFVTFYGSIPSHLKVKVRGHQTQKRLEKYQGVTA